MNSQCLSLLLSWACMLAMALDIYCIIWIWVAKRDFDPADEGFGGLISVLN
jgi:hypothetical protein